jgi:hypothetical protein
MLYGLPEIFCTLPSYSDDLFQALWLNKRLCYTPNVGRPDEVDICNAQLLCEAVKRKEHLLIVLPDLSPHRPAMLLATTILYHLPSLYSSNSRKGPQKLSNRILYFGNSIGIREQLGQVRISKSPLDLSDVFRQADITRRGSVRETVASNGSDSLPEVITIYSPANPENLIGRYSPLCVAIDLDNSPEINWLNALLKALEKHQIPVVAWSQNPLSECVNIFKEFGHSLIWPPSLLEINPNDPVDGTTQIQALILESENSQYIGETLKVAAQTLLSPSKLTLGQLGLDAVHQHWQLLRGIETLLVPLEFYESEAETFFGLKSFARMREGCEHFRKASQIAYPGIIEPLERSMELLEDVLKTFQYNDPPLWTALANYCIHFDSAESRQFIVFSGRSRKELFLLAMLAYHNITEEDLASIGIYAMTIRELLTRVQEKYSSIKKEDIQQKILFVGLPSRRVHSRLLPLLFYDEVDFLIYPHQAIALKYRVEEINLATSFNIGSWQKLLRTYNPHHEKLASQLNPRSNRLNFCMPQTLAVNNIERRPASAPEVLLRIGTPVAEIERILMFEDESDNDSFIFHESSADEVSKKTEPWCEQIVHISFMNGTFVNYPVDEIINVVKYHGKNAEVKEWFVRALRPGDRVVFIHNQRRQDFYELLISRLHQHPGMIFHLNLIRRWQDDFVKAYRQWSLEGTRSIGTLLDEMRNLGSELISPMTLRNWLQGKTLCPDEAEDLRRLAEILSMKYVVQNYRKISHSAKRLSGLHRGLARKLNRWLTSQAAGGEIRNDDEIIDSELNLSFADLQNSLILLDVQDVETLQGLWLRNGLGKLEN